MIKPNLIDIILLILSFILLFLCFYSVNQNNIFNSVFVNCIFLLPYGKYLHTKQILFMNKKLPLFPKLLMLLAFLMVSFGCSSLAEDAEEINESENFYTELIAQLENMQWETNIPNARNSQAIPTFRVTITTLQKMNVVQLAVIDQATVLIATDEAYNKIGITPDNVGENLQFLGAIVFNQTMSDQTIKGSSLTGKSYTNMMGLPLTFSEENGKISVSDAFGNQANVIRTDWSALKSTSHFIDNVLVPMFE